MLHARALVAASNQRLAVHGSQGVFTKQAIGPTEDAL